MKRLLFLVMVACGGSSKPAPEPVRPVVELPIVEETKPPPAPLAYLDGTITTLATKYIEPARFDFHKMLRGALDGMEENVAEVIAEVTNDQVTVRVDEQHQTFAGDVDSLMELNNRLTDIVRFVQQHAASTDKGEIELAAVNGMLSTLDPHTVLISAKEMEEWNVNLTGKFGGLGVVIGMKNDRITVDKVFPNTPADRAGLRTADRVVAVNGQPTESLTLDETMSRMRGDPGTSVRLVIERGADKLDLPLTRAEIKIPVVESRMLEGKVGYVSLDRFDEATAKELEVAMEALRDQGARGWVVDLRQNSGGYLTQAVKSADLFVEYGTIVSTVAGGKKHDIKNATSGGIDTRRPVVVLISENTASAAEILSGALKQLDRAVLVGRRSFGKGSVQVMIDSAHGSKLKITTSEYVASNDISPQGGGINPDIELVPALVPKQITDAEPLRLVPEPPFRELDLGAHLDTTQKRDETKPLATITYRKTEEPDFEIRVAREAVLAGARTRKDSLAKLPRVIDKLRADADRDLAIALKALGIDWAKGKAGKLAVTFDSDLRATTGEVITLRGEVRNIGTTPAHRVIAHATSPDPTLDGVELVFGKIAPGAKKQATAVVKLPRGSASRVSTIHWKLDSGETATTQLAIAGTPFPDFTVTAQVVDDNDGIPRAGETMRVRAKITNRGPGRSTKTVATLTSLVGERLLVDRGRLDLGLLEPNQSRDIELVFASAPKLDLERLSLDLAIADANLDVGQRHKLEMNVGEKLPPALEITPPRVRIADVPLETTEDKVTVTGSAEDEKLVGDVYITVSNRTAKLEERKVFYAAGKQKSLDFTAQVPLAVGVNRIIVTAREHAKAQTVRTIWVMKR